MVWPVVAAIAAGALSNELQNQQTRKADKNAKKAMEAVLAQYNGITSPELQEYNPDKYQWQGDLQLDNIDAGMGTGYQDVASEFDNISLDQQLREKQLASMGALDDIISGGGMNAMDKANLSRVQSEAAQADRGRREAILQNMAARGMGGSGMELLAQLQSNQAATDRQAQQGLDIAGMAQQRALEAIMQQGNQAGNLRGQDFSEQSTKAQASDAIAKFNAQNKLSNDQFNKTNQLNVAQWNAGQNNDAKAQNWQGKQNLQNANVDMSNDAQTKNNAAKQQGFENNLNIAQGKAAAMTGQQQYYQNQAAQKAKQTGDLFNAGASAVASYYGAKK